jgi:hypothetical protein
VARKARFRGNYKGVGQMLRSRQMQEEMRQRAEDVKNKAVALAPRDTGSYVSSFRVETGVRGGSKPRAQAKVINDDSAAPYVEWGTARTPRFRVLGRAAGTE